MADTAIQWADKVWNPTTGCDRISPGCDRCYALTMAGRLKAMGQPKYQRDGDPRTSGPGFALTCHPDALEVPLGWRKPRRVFVNSMSDLFHEDVPAGFVADAFGVMAVAHQQRGHVFQVLTKRPRRMAGLVVGGLPYHANHLSAANGMPLDYETFREAVACAASRWAHDRVDSGWVHDGIAGGLLWPLPGVWLGTSIEDDRYAFRARILREVPAAVRFLSLEPLIGPVPHLDLDGIGWVIVGGESGPGARPLDLGWVREVRDRCAEAGVAFFMKQLGTAWARERAGSDDLTDIPGHRLGDAPDGHGGDWDFWPADLRVRQWPGEAAA